MFRMTPPPPRVRADIDVSIGVDVIDAEKIQKAFKRLPQVLRLALLWCYVKRSRPGLICKQLNVSMESLSKLLHTARDEMSIQQIK
jgi:DNA-directed RNA polymerase specialized sigma24 family protein